MSRQHHKLKRPKGYIIGHLKYSALEYNLYPPPKRNDMIIGEPIRGVHAKVKNVNKGIHARYINDADNVPFFRVYKSHRSFMSAKNRMKHATFVDAVDFDTYTLIKADDLR